MAERDRRRASSSKRDRASPTTRARASTSASSAPCGCSSATPSRMRSARRSRPALSRRLRVARTRSPTRARTPWTKESGLLSIWILGMFKPSPATTVVIPFRAGPEAELGPVVNDAYFGKVPADRLRREATACSSSAATAQQRGKIGLPPRARDRCSASYDAARGVLTLVRYTCPRTRRDYVNSMWEIQKEPYARRRRQQLQRRPARAGREAARPLLRARDLVARRRRSRPARA